VPVVRFGHDLAPEANDPQALAFARNVLALPCHQELSDAELAWIIERARAACEAAIGTEAGTRGDI